VALARDFGPTPSPNNRNPAAMAANHKVRYSDVEQGRFWDWLNVHNTVSWSRHVRTPQSSSSAFLALIETYRKINGVF
jgi:hypothetical protein